MKYCLNILLFVILIGCESTNFIGEFYNKSSNCDYKYMPILVENIDNFFRTYKDHPLNFYRDSTDFFNWANNLEYLLLLSINTYREKGIKNVDTVLVCFSFPGLNQPIDTLDLGKHEYRSILIEKNIMPLIFWEATEGSIIVKNMNNEFNVNISQKFGKSLSGIASRFHSITGTNIENDTLMFKAMFTHKNE